MLEFLPWLLIGCVISLGDGSRGVGGGNSSGRVVEDTDGNWRREKRKQPRARDLAATRGVAAQRRRESLGAFPRCQGSGVGARRYRFPLRESEPGQRCFGSPQTRQVCLSPVGRTRSLTQGRFLLSPAAWQAHRCCGDHQSLRDLLWLRQGRSLRKKTRGRGSQSSSAWSKGL